MTNVRRLPTEKEMARAALFHARELLARPRGWIKGISRQLDYETGKTAYCSSGAIREVVAPMHGEVRAKAERALRDAVKEKYPEFADVGRLISIIGFNDAKKTRKKHVLAAFDRAIELLS